ncbi:MAG TPA: iron chelate uptake ABC transporter family permease subunit [Cellulomonas sp.]
MTTGTPVADAPAVRTSPGRRVLRLGPYSCRLATRPLLIAAVLVALLLVAFVITLTAGDLGLSPGETWAALWGDGEARAVRSIQQRRTPRMLTAVGVGGCLAVSGALFQSLSRNALGSPDVIGFTTGAATAAVVQMVFFDRGLVATAVATVVGGLVTALVVYLLARRDGVTGGLRLVLVGIGTGAVLGAVTDFVIVRADITDAATVQQWTSGSLTGRGWTHAVAVLLVAAVLVPVLAVLARRVSVLELGDDVAAGLGIRVERLRFATVVLAVLLVGIATAATGPISFIALAAPQIARRATRTPAIPVAASFLTGGLLLAVADLLAQYVDVGLRTPVGLVTSLIGGVYLIWLLARRA